MKKAKSYWGIGSVLILLLMQGCSLQTSVKTPEPIAAVLLPEISIPGLPESATVESERIDSEVNYTEINDSWEYIISLYAIPEINNREIERQIKKFLAQPDYIAIIQTRAQPFLYNIIKQIEEKGLPGELALLPAIESGFKAHAYSRAKAAGLWQFIPSTGRVYGLKQNWWYDGRRDVYSSTAAATSYLQKLAHKYDNDWLLALAAYNAGMGNVNKAIRRNTAKNLPTDFWSLKLPRETKAYVPKLLALARIFANAEYYGVTLKKQTHKPTFVAVDIGSQLELSKAAQLSEISLQALFRLNPGFNRGYTPPNGPHRLLIPVENAALFQYNLSQLTTDQRATWQRHKIKAGQTLGSIAHLYQTNIKMIREVNQLKNNKIRAGSYLLLPVNKNTAGMNPFVQAASLNQSNKYPTYTVKSGDSLWTIARKFGVSSKQLANWNKIGLRSTLRLGQSLVIKKTIQHTA